MAKLTNPLLDTIFKIIFGKEGVSEEFLIDFLNQVFAGDSELGNIVSVQYGNPERIENDARSKRIIYDIHCTTSSGHRFILEMQRANQRNFVKRMLYYISRLITDQVKRIKEENKLSDDAVKKSEYEYMPVVGVFICDFEINGFPRKTLTRCFVSDEEDGHIITRDVRMAFVQLPFFNKKKEECVTGFDMWVYILKNMENLDTLPFREYRDQLFERLEKVVSYAALSKEEQAEYDKDWKWAMDYNETVLYQYDRGVETGFKKGIEKGIEKGIKKGRAEGIEEGIEKGEKLQAWKTAEILHQKSMPLDFISEVTRIPIKELQEKFS